MKKARFITSLLVCVALACGLMFMGCGKSSDVKDTLDQVTVANACTDACNTMMTCLQESIAPIELSEEEIAAGLAECTTECNNPGDAEDEAIRDCALACDTSTDCDTYAECLCDCGIEVIGDCA